MPKYIRFGLGFDKNLFYECPYCGTINRTDRNKANKFPYSILQDAVLESNPIETGNPFISGIEDLVLPKTNQDGSENNNVRPVFSIKPTTGCWFCGCVNI